MKSKKSKTLLFANVVLGSIITTCILAIALLCYKSISFHIPFNFILGFFLSIILLFSIISLFLSDSRKINVAIAIFSTLLASYSVELALFFRFNDHFSQTEIDTRNKLEVIDDLRKEGVDAWPLVIPYFFTESNRLLSDKNRIFPLGGISNKTIVYCNESGQYGIFDSDEHGFNNPKGLYEKNSTKLLIIGDSFAIGNCVKPGEDIAGQLRDMGINTLNLGNGGNGPLIELAILKEYAESLQPEIVLWIYYEGNDLHDLKRERNVSILIRYLQDDFSQNLIIRQIEIDTVLINYVNQQWKNELDRPHIKKRIINQPLHMQKQKRSENRRKIIALGNLRDRLGLTSKDSQTQNPSSERITSYKTQLSLFSEILEIADHRTSGWGGKLYFVYLPTMERYLNGNNSGSFFDRDEVLTIIHKLGIPLIDFHNILNKHPDPLSLTPFLGAHYNAEGYKLISELIVSQLRKDKMVYSD
jgi:hypothetical protein